MTLIGFKPQGSSVQTMYDFLKKQRVYINKSVGFGCLKICVENVSVQETRKSE